MTTLITERNETQSGYAAHALIVATGRFQGEDVQKQLERLGWSCETAVGGDLGQVYLLASPYDLVVIDVDLGYPVIGSLVEGLRLRQPQARLAMMLGWWDNRLTDMASFSDLMIFKPTHPDQVRQVVGAVSP